MAESKTKSRASVKPASTGAETKPTAKTTAKPAAKPPKSVKTAAAEKAVVKPDAIAKSKAGAAQESGEKKSAAPRKAKAFNKNKISAELRYRMIAEAAYYIAQQRGFSAGDAGADWAQAEAQIAQLLDK